MEMDIQDEIPNYEEYNQNNRLVNDINYSYYFHKNKNLKNNTDENSDNSLNNNLNNSNNNINENNDINNDSQNKLSTPYNKYNYNTSRISSSIDIKANERQRKKILLENIQSQINIRKKAKLEELQKEKEEDTKYLKEMIEKYPFGRSGGGAPIRNKKGEVSAFRRNLISDKKYNQYGINIDDDFDEIRKRNNINNDININNRYNTPIQRPYSTINVNKINNDMNNDLSNSYDLRNYNKDLDNKIYERRMKLLELQKEQEEIKNQELKEENKKLENELYLKNNINKNNIINYKKQETPVEETEEENQYETSNTTNIINNNNNIKEIFNNIKPKLNPLDYYDNYNFVPKSKINQRLDNNFLFTEELSKLRKELEIQQTSLLKQISQLKDASLLAKNERNKVYKDLELIKYQIEKLKEQNKKNETDEENSYVNNNIGKDYDNYLINNLQKNENDYDYIDEMFFDKYEKELPYNSKIKKEKKIFHLEKNYEDKDLIELDKLIKKSDDIIQNFKENELLEKKFSKKPEDYFDTSDYYFDTYMLTHKNDFLDYANDYNKINNKFMEYNTYDENNKNGDYEINIEKI